MLEPSITTYKDQEDNDFYFFSVKEEELTYSIPLTRYQLEVLESGLDGCLYQGVLDLALEFCNIQVNERKNIVSIMFINYAPVLTFEIQKTYVINILQDIKEVLG